MTLTVLSADLLRFPNSFDFRFQKNFFLYVVECIDRPIDKLVYKCYHCIFRIKLQVIHMCVFY